MKTIEINYYTIKELKEINEVGYTNAHKKYMEHFEFAWVNEVTESLEKFLGLFNCQLTSWDADYKSVYYRQGDVSIYNEEEDDYDYYELNQIEGKMLTDYLLENCHEDVSNWEQCPLTGVCYDVDLLEPLHEFLTGEKYQDYTLHDLIELATYNLMKVVENEIYYLMSEKYFIEIATDNDWYFDINGNLE